MMGSLFFIFALYPLYDFRAIYLSANNRHYDKNSMRIYRIILVKNYLLYSCMVMNRDRMNRVFRPISIYRVEVS